MRARRHDHAASRGARECREGTLDLTGVKHIHRDRHPFMCITAKWAARLRVPPPTVEELDAMTASRPMSAEQAASLKRLAQAAYELDAYKPNLTRAEASLRIAMLTAKLKLLDGPPHTL
jgi:Protein of unknown function (DUF3072)